MKGFTDEEFKELVDATVKEMRKRYVNSWAKLSLYFESQVDKGVKEFRISVQNTEGDVIIHPLGVDGDTLDINLKV